jgi:cyclopropane fatty-acyl-phospholipid synthase-like methyltransferase
VTPGALARKVLGKRGFHAVAAYYRGIFGDLAKVADAVSEHVPPGAHVLDIGGGDGAPLNYLLALRPDIRVTMIDLAATIGGAIEPVHASRVEIFPQTSIRDYLATGGVPPQAVLISDVLHHVPEAQRASFFADLHDVATYAGGVCLIVKDVEPKGFRAWLSYVADRYISGDRTVSLISQAELCALVEREFGPTAPTKTTLYQRDAPNYALVFGLR